jgi:cytidine deaminase
VANSALIAAARAAAQNAHAPYSGFAVGAAVELADGTVIGGCNLENASYGLTMCAEAVALGAVNSQGKLRQVRRVAITGGKIGEPNSDPVRPCGRCRQLISEAAQLSDCDVEVICAGSEGKAFETHAISALLPLPFGPKDLGLA